jgi:hypothetical protein
MDAMMSAKVPPLVDAAIAQIRHLAKEVTLTYKWHYFWR